MAAIRDFTRSTVHGKLPLRHKRKRETLDDLARDLLLATRGARAIGMIGGKQ